jgi:hypothetical protein
MADTPNTPSPSPIDPNKIPGVEDIFATVKGAKANDPIVPERPAAAPQAPTPAPTASRIPEPVAPLSDAPAPVPQTSDMQAVPTPEGAAITPPPAPRRRVGRGSRVRLIVTVSIVLIVLVVVAGFAVFTTQFRGTDTQADNAVENINQVAPVTDTTNDAETSTPLVRDSDGDGLLDEEEAEFRTDPKKIDSDNDGLTDRQEVKIYQTDPNRKDTDRDGFSDGEEVRQFYDPNGPGRLLDIPEAIEEFNAQQ